MDIKVRKRITRHWMHHPWDDIEYLYDKKENGRKGLYQLEWTYKTNTIGWKKYLDITTISNHTCKTKEKYSICKI